MRTYGAKYDKTSSTVEVARRFREDVKKAIARAELPAGLKLSIRTKHFSGGSAIDATITAAPRITILNAERLEIEREEPDIFHADGPPIYTETAMALLKKLRAMLDAYNHDGSEIASDYFDVKFYSNVRFAWELEKAERLASEGGTGGET